MKVIKVREYSMHPGLRHCSISDYSGEEFYHKILNEAFYQSYVSKESLMLDLDGTNGYPPSFLDEAIGNLVFDFSLEKVKKYIKFKSDEEEYLLEDIENNTYPNWEKRRVQDQKPKKTKEHSEWYRLIDGNIETIQ
jgi:hypothetical protein